MIKAILRTLATLCICALIPSSVMAVENSLAVITDRPASFVGQELIISIVLTADKLDIKPELPQIVNAKTHFVDSQVTANDDKQVFMFRYSCLPLKAGEITIPALTVKIGETELSSTERKIEILELMTTDKLKLTTELSSTKVYLGQPLTLKFTWESKIPLSSIKALDLFLPILSHQAFKNKDKKTNVQRTKRTIGIPVNNTRVIANSWEKKEGNVTTFFLSFEKVIIPQKTGVFEFTPSRLICSAVKPLPPGQNKKRNRWNQYPSYFNNDFFANASDTKKWDRFIVNTERTKIEVQALPPEGQPANFNGIIGKFDLEVTATPLDAKVGTPVTLTMIVKNYPYVEIIDLPALKSQPTLAHNFMVPKERSPGLFKDNTKVFIQSIRPTSDKVTFIPAIRVSYFEPTTGKYEFAQSTPIAISVTPNDSFTEFDLDFADGSTIKNVVEKNQVGIRHNYEVIDINSTKSASISVYDPQFFIVLLLIPIIIFGLITISAKYTNCKKNNSKQIISKNAFKKFRKVNLNTDASIDEALRSYFGDRFDLKHSTVTFADMERVSGLNKEVITPLATVKEFYDHFDHSNFAEQETKSSSYSADHKTIKNAVKKINSSVKVTLSLLCCFLISIVQADQDIDSNSSIYSSANKLFADAHELIAKDLTRGQILYKNAALKFQYLAQTAPSKSAKSALLYNAGNAYFFADDYGMSLYNYLQAELYTPHDDNLLNNIKYLRSMRIDEFEKSDFTLFIENTFFWHYNFSSKVRFWLFYSSYALLWLIISIYFKNARQSRTLLISLIIIPAVIGSSIIIHQFSDYGQRGVVTAETAVARKGDNYAYEPAFNGPLHAATEFSCLEQRGSWSLLLLEDGEQCWVQSDTIKLVNR